jgi:hypothetical protein
MSNIWKKFKSPYIKGNAWWQKQLHVEVKAMGFKLGLVIGHKQQWDAESRTN